MSIVGFNFTKISAERKNAVVGTVNINNNISLKDMTEAKLGLAGGTRGALTITFAFKSEYMPDHATLLLEGDVLTLVDAKLIPGMLESWSKTKSIPKEIAQQLMNYILDRCNIQALLLAKDLNLPSPVPLPKVQVNLPKQAEVPETKKPDVKKKGK